MAQQSDKFKQERTTIPEVGMSRWKQFAPFSPFSREKFRQLSLAGKAPQPVRFSERCTAYHNQDLLKFLADPLNYSAGAVHDGQSENVVDALASASASGGQ
jgi:prophage regulatory protein